MEKMYTEFVAYGGEGPSGYTYCNADPIGTSVGDNGGANISVELVGPPPQPPTVVAVPMVPQQYAVEYKLEPVPLQPHRVKQENLEEKSLSMRQSLARQEKQSCSETQTQTQMADDALGQATAPYFVQVMQEVSNAFAVEDKKQVIIQQKAAEAAVAVHVIKKKKNRQKVADPKSWTSNVRKTKHQRGEAYISRRGKYVPERQIKSVKDCRTSCKLHCSQQLNETDRQHIFNAFYSLSSNEKKHFLLNTTERHSVKRPTKIGNNDEPKRKYSFKYFFLVRAVRYNVCKAFYLGTLAISQKPIYNVHAYKSDMNLPKPDGRGLAPTSAHSIAPERKERVRSHIASFPVVDSSGSGSSKNRKYLDSSLSVKKMHYLYVEECKRDGVTPVKESMYRKIFNSDFNLHFKKNKVKVERCENCKHPIKRKNS